MTWFNKPTDVLPIALLNGGTRSAASFGVAMRHFSPVGYDLGLVKPNFIAVYLDNLERLGFLETTYLESMAKDGAYDGIEVHEVFLRYKAHIIETTGDFRSERGLARITNFGRLFMKVCGPVGG